MRTVRLNRNTWSASATGSPWLKLISSWAGPLSWLMVSMSICCCLAVVVDVIDDGIEIVGRVDAVGLAHLLRPARAADRRLQRIVRIEVLLHQIELELRRHHGPPAVLMIKIDHPLEHVARGDVDRPVVDIEAVADHLRSRVLVPRHDPHGVVVGAHVDVDRGLVGGIGLERIAPRDGQDEDVLGDSRPCASLAPLTNFDAGRILPRAVPDMSGTRHSTSSMSRLISHSSNFLSSWSTV
jgi:hypothetical protein